MDNPWKVIEDLKKLKPSERQIVLVGLLFDGSIDFNELSTAYVKALEKQREAHWQKINRLGIRLGGAWHHIPNKKRFTKAAAAFALIKAEVFKTAAIEKEFKAYLADNPYDEDEYGGPKTSLRDEGSLPRKYKRGAATPTPTHPTDPTNTKEKETM